MRYEEMWGLLKIKLESMRQYHKDGQMQSMTESIQGEAKCDEILKYMECLEHEQNV